VKDSSWQTAATSPLYNPRFHSFTEERLLNRREFHISVLQLSASALLAPRLFALSRASDSSGVADLYKRAMVIDSLCSPFTGSGSSPSSELLAIIRQSGMTAETQPRPVNRLRFGILPDRFQCGL